MVSPDPERSVDGASDLRHESSNKCVSWLGCNGRSCVQAPPPTTRSVEDGIPAGTAGTRAATGPRDELEQKLRNTKARCRSTTYPELPGRFLSLYLSSPGSNANSRARNYGLNARASQILAVRS